VENSLQDPVLSLFRRDESLSFILSGKVCCPTPSGVAYDAGERQELSLYRFPLSETYESPLLSNELCFFAFAIDQPLLGVLPPLLARPTWRPSKRESREVVFYRDRDDLTPPSKSALMGITLPRTFHQLVLSPPKVTADQSSPPPDRNILEMFWGPKSDRRAPLPSEFSILIDEASCPLPHGGYSSKS